MKLCPMLKKNALWLKCKPSVQKITFSEVFMKMKGYAMLKLGETGWIEKDVPACGPLDAICKPLALAPCTSDVHTV